MERGTERVFKDGKSGVEPKLSLFDLGKLVEIRNNVVHAAVSCPSQLGKKEKKSAIEALRELKAGWALSIAASLVKELHSEVGTTPPDYVKNGRTRLIVSRFSS